MRAARFLGIPPWQLAEQPVAWREWALRAEEAEAKVEANAAERNSRPRH